MEAQQQQHTIGRRRRRSEAIPTIHIQDNVNGGCMCRRDTAMNDDDKMVVDKTTQEEEKNEKIY